MGEIYHNYFGIDFYIYPNDNKRHKLPHIHAYSSDGDLVISLNDCSILEGKMKKSKELAAIKWTKCNIIKLRYIWSIAEKGNKPPKLKDIGDDCIC